MLKTLIFVLLALAAPLLHAAEQTPQTTFSEAEDAVTALGAALQQNDRDAFLDIFGRQYEEELIGGDEANAAENLRIVGRAMQTYADLVDDGTNRKTLVIGSENWPFPFPLVKEEGRWRFDTAEGIEEVVAY